MKNRSIIIAYILWLFLGQLGVHRFYTGRTTSGLLQLILGAAGWATAGILIGWFPLFVLWIWLIIDIFLIPGMCRNPE